MKTVVVKWQIRTNENGAMLYRREPGQPWQRIGGTFPNARAAQTRMEQYIHAENRLKVGLLAS